MANHAHIVVDELPSFEEVDKLIRDYTTERFPVLKIEKLEFEENGWYIGYDEYHGICLWLSEVELAETEDDWNSKTAKKEGKIKKYPCFEFRHGHSMDIFWWIEKQYRSLLARTYNGKGYDEGWSSYALDDFIPPESDSTYYDYCVEKFADRSEMARKNGRTEEEIEDTNKRIIAFYYSELSLRPDLLTFWEGPVPEMYEELFAKSN